MNREYQITTMTIPEATISLSGSYEQELSMTIESEGTKKTIRLDRDSILQLQSFLVDFLQPDTRSTQQTFFAPTGRALAIMDVDSLNTVRVLFEEQNLRVFCVENESHKMITKAIEDELYIDIPGNPLFVFFDTFDGTISRNTLRRIIRACVVNQIAFVRSGIFNDCHRMVLEDIERYTDIDSSIISRATKNTSIVAPIGRFSLNSTDSSLDIPSLFDEGAKRTDGSVCSRKYVLASLEEIIKNEDKNNPMVDEEITVALNHMGFDVARRTVAKYRDILGIPTKRERKDAYNSNNE